MQKNQAKIKDAETIINEYLAKRSDIEIIEVDKTPSFSTDTKIIRMPKKCQFDSIEEYYNTLFHEMVHSTLGITRDAERSSAFREQEELTAEIGAAYLCGYAGISDTEIIKNNAAYCAGWMQTIRSQGAKILVKAASRAEAAVNYILGINRDEQCMAQD
jgi:antirestriction protein ArdC